MALLAVDVQVVAGLFAVTVVYAVECIVCSVGIVYRRPVPPSVMIKIGDLSPLYLCTGMTAQYEANRESMKIPNLSP